MLSYIIRIIFKYYSINRLEYITHTTSPPTPLPLLLTTVHFVRVVPAVVLAVTPVRLPDTLHVGTLELVIGAGTILLAAVLTLV